jgi:hypothetical protein
MHIIATATHTRTAAPSPGRYRLEDRDEYGRLPGPPPIAGGAPDPAGLVAFDGHTDRRSPLTPPNAYLL